MMLRVMIMALVGTLALGQTALAQDSAGDDFAEYGVSVGVSPFGGSLNLNYNTSKKTSYFAVLGGLPGGEMDVDVDGTDYAVKTDSSWVGFFVQHRPFVEAAWFRVVTGIGIGTIENELTDPDGNVFQANYYENPVGYLGVGFGAQPTKGFSIGFDLGWLQTAGPVVSGPDAAAVESIKDHVFFGNALPNAQLTLGWNF